MFGSIGIAASFLVDESIVEIASTEAPKKRPDVSTAEGKAIVREELDAIHEVFVEAIARGRSTTTTNVNRNFGRGAIVLARDAKRAGMIDSIAAGASGAGARAATRNISAASAMDRVVEDMQKAKELRNAMPSPRGHILLDPQRGARR
jgi:ClpP class serine protease